MLLSPCAQTVRITSSAAFDKLCTLAEEFRKYGGLFAPALTSVSREQQTAEQNVALDAQIEGFLMLLSPYFQQQPAQQALEWLLRQFKIHDENILAILACILP